jgi:hypothetical protein
MASLFGRRKKERHENAESSASIPHPLFKYIVTDYRQAVEERSGLFILHDCPSHQVRALE